MQSGAELNSGNMDRSKITHLTEVALQNLSQRLDCRNRLLNDSNINTIGRHGLAISGESFTKSLQTICQSAPVLASGELLPPTVVRRNIVQDVVQSPNSWNRLLNDSDINSISRHGLAISGESLAHAFKALRQRAPILPTDDFLPPTIIGRNIVQEVVQRSERRNRRPNRLRLKIGNRCAVRLERGAHPDKAIG